jgi:hypothetical protein
MLNKKTSIKFKFLHILERVLKKLIYWKMQMIRDNDFINKDVI